MINLILYPISIIPTVLIYLWLKKKVLKEDKAAGKKALLYGFKAVFPIILMSMILAILEKLIFREESVLRAFYHSFFVLALSEELAKGYMLYKLYRQLQTYCPGPDIIVYMVNISIGFSLLESALYALTTNAAQIMVRGLTFPHLGYGFIMGYFAEKGITDNRRYFVAAFLIPWILHGSYDFCLAPVLGDDNVFVALMALALAVLSIALTVAMILYVKKSTDVSLKPN